MLRLLIEDLRAVHFTAQNTVLNGEKHRARSSYDDENHLL